MKLFEKEAKQILEERGLEGPMGESDEYVVKAQVLAKNRMEHGGIKFADSFDKAEEIARDMIGSDVNGHRVSEILIEPKIEFDREYYVSMIYDTDIRAPVMIFSREGGTGVEGRDVQTLEVVDREQWRIREFLNDCGIESGELVKLASALQKVVDTFFDEDMRMLEINPLVRTEDGYVVVDAMADLDDDADYRRDREYEDRSSFGRRKTERELEAEEIDKDDHRGVAGKYTELEGDIAMMLAGGGASLTNMDAILAYGGEPANYTEYGGNPPMEKVYRLTKVILSKPGLNGCWHVGGTANNTDIYRTMKGFCQALEEVQPEYPIVVRRDGPNADKAFELLRETRDELGLNMKLFRNDTPMTKTAEILMDMVEEYREDKDE